MNIKEVIGFYMIGFLLRQRSHNILLFGLLYLFIFSLPTIFVGAALSCGGPNSPCFSSALMMFMLMHLIGVGTCLILFKIIDSILIKRVCWGTFSYVSILIGSLVYAILFNVFVDNLYQFNKGDYSYSVWGIKIFIIFWLLVICLGSINILVKKLK